MIWHLEIDPPSLKYPDNKLLIKFRFPNKSTFGLTWSYFEGLTPKIGISGPRSISEFNFMSIRTFRGQYNQVSQRPHFPTTKFTFTLSCVRTSSYPDPKLEAINSLNL